MSVLQHLARAAFERKDLDGAQRLYRRILERLPEDPVAIGFLGVIATGRRQYDVAHDLLLRALTIAPDAPEGFNNLGLFEHSRADFAAAVAAYRRALELAPDYSAAHNNLGLALQEQGEVGAAIESFRAAVRAFPDFADAHWNLALALLLAGELEEGFAEQEWRMRVAQHREWWARRQQFPQWQGEPLAGKRILILAEQGMGDMIQFVRYATPLAAQGATVMVEAAPELADLLRTVPGVREVVSPDPPFPRCDVQIPMLSLPLRCGTRLGTIPAPLRYLGVDPVRRARWQQLLGPPVKPRIGIAWAGNPEHVRDRYRSLAVAHFASLLAMPEYEWLGLQKGPAAGQIAALPPECVIRDLGKDSLTFADLAALIELLDLVITVDTAIVHVAGALGKSALLLLDTAHDWRWPRGGSEARWYPSVQIVRQPSRGDWAGAMLLAAEAMQRLCPVAAPANAIKARPQ